MAILSGFFVKETFGTACRLGRVFRLHKGGKSSPTYDRCNDESIFAANNGHTALVYCVPHCPLLAV
jgi:hypothetical protein